MWCASNWFVGIISGLISSTCFFMILFFIKPKILVSDSICKSTNKNGETIYKVKIVNKTRSMLVDVNYSLFYKTIHSDGIDSIVEIQPYKSPLKYVSQYNKSENKNNDYAVRITYLIKEEDFPINDNTRLVFSFMASHQTTGTTKAISKEYSKNEIKEGLFETGVSTKILEKR